MTDIFDEIPDTNKFWVNIQGATIESHFDVSVYLNARDEWLEKAREELREAKAQSRVNHQHRMLYQSQRDEAKNIIHLLRYLVEDYLPQIGMTIHFREIFYQIVGEPYPDWFEVPEPGFYELEWMEKIRGLTTSVRNKE